MTIRYLNWKVDTCQCILWISYDDAVGTDTTRTFTAESFDNVCNAHVAQGATPQSLYTVTLEETRRRNFSLDTLLTNVPVTVYDVDPISGVRNLKGGIEFTYSWTGTAPNRVLSVSLRGITLTNAQRTTIQTALNTRFGSGKVTIV